MKRLTDSLPEIESVITRGVKLKEPFVDMGARFAQEPGTVLLLSGGDLDCSRYNILALRPWLTLEGRTGETTAVVNGRLVRVPLNPLDTLEKVLEHCHLPGTDVPYPIAAGLFGYLAYDLKDGLETLPRTSVDDLELPLLTFFAPSLILVQDKVSGTARTHAPVFRGETRERAELSIDAFTQSLKAPAPSSRTFSNAGRPLKSNFSRPAYVRAIQRIREYIAAGDVYQVNMSQRFETGFCGDSYSLFKTLFEMNPAPFFAFVNAGDHQIVSTSPERFIRRKGRRVETRPIKGTRPRGKTPNEDQRMKTELAASPKDDAELSMIVDLLRNDIGKVCSGGSVVVTQHKRLETYQNVYHLVSVVEGELAEGKNSVDLVRATFPGGSITGCPKIRSMEIIDELESRRRHIYTGSIGYISFHDTLDLSIAIRTATIVDSRLVFSVGGGIVYDSEPEDEFEETLHKGKTLMSVFNGEGCKGTTGADPPRWVWQDGRLIPQPEASVPITDLGFQYGFGFFETLRVERGHIFRLNAHLDRFNRTWSTLFSGSPPDLSWREVVDQVVDANGLTDDTAAVKILATRGRLTSRGDRGVLLVTARPYIYRLSALGVDGLKLATYPHPRMTPLADFKTLNYLYYLNAGAWARKNRAHEALILNPDGTVSETNTANLLILWGRTAIRPVSPHVLPGVMQAAASTCLIKMGFSVEDRPIGPGEVTKAASILLTNALMGVVPAVNLDGRHLRADPELVTCLNDKLFGTDYSWPYTSKSKYLS